MEGKIFPNWRWLYHYVSMMLLKAFSAKTQTRKHVTRAIQCTMPPFNNVKNTFFVILNKIETKLDCIERKFKI